MAGVVPAPPEKVTAEMGVQTFASKVKTVYAEKSTETITPKAPPVLETEDAGCQWSEQEPIVHVKFEEPPSSSEEAEVVKKAPKTKKRAATKTKKKAQA